MSLDIDFPFGANDSSERTAVVTEAERITWADIEAVRRVARADVATVANASWSRALLMVARIRHPSLRAWAMRWVHYCTAPGLARPVRHAGQAGKACRRVELALSRLGIVDPDGFETVERAPRRKRAVKGVFRGVAGQLQEYNERMRGPWIG